jgi:hypothetical protein
MKLIARFEVFVTVTSKRISVPDLRDSVGSAMVNENNCFGPDVASVAKETKVIAQATK